MLYELLYRIKQFIFGHNWSQLIAIISLIISLYIVGWITHRISIKYISCYLEKLLTSHKSSKFIKTTAKYSIFSRLAYIVPALIISASLNLFIMLGVSIKIIDIITRVINIYMLFIVTTCIFRILQAIQDIHYNDNLHKLPIKSYLQIIKIIISVLVSLVTISILFKKSLLILLTGIGATTAVIMVTFKDTILNFISSIILTVENVVKIGDWLENSQFHANGYVADISLNFIKIKNFDKTIVAIPTYTFLNSCSKNWRKMQKAGGRCVARVIKLDMHYIKFLTTPELQILKQKIPLLAQHIDKQLTHSSPFLTTNEILFRTYSSLYLKQHNSILHDHFTLLVRQLEPEDNSLPIKLYCFLNDKDFYKHEEIQSNIFSHLFAILPTFELKVSQYQK